MNYMLVDDGQCAIGPFESEGEAEAAALRVALHRDYRILPVWDPQDWEDNERSALGLPVPHRPPGLVVIPDAAYQEDPAEVETQELAILELTRHYGRLDADIPGAGAGAGARGDADTTPEPLDPVDEYGVSLSEYPSCEHSTDEVGTGGCSVCVPSAVREQRVVDADCAGYEAAVQEMLDRIDAAERAGEPGDGTLGQGRAVE